MTNFVASSWPRRINRYNIEPVQKEYWVTGYPHCELAAFVITVDTWLFILWLFVVSGGVFDNQIRTYHNQFSMFLWFFPRNICVFFPWKLYLGCFERDRILPYCLHLTLRILTGSEHRLQRPANTSTTFDMKLKYKDIQKAVKKTSWR